MEARQHGAAAGRLVEHSIGTSTLRDQHCCVRMSPLPATHPQIPNGTVENQIPLLPVINTSNVLPLGYINSS